MENQPRTPLGTFERIYSPDLNRRFTVRLYQSQWAKLEEVEDKQAFIREAIDEAFKKAEK